MIEEVRLAAKALNIEATDDRFRDLVQELIDERHEQCGPRYINALLPNHQTIHQKSGPGPKLSNRLTFEVDFASPKKSVWVSPDFFFEMFLQSRTVSANHFERIAWCSENLDRILGVEYERQRREDAQCQ